MKCLILICCAFAVAHTTNPILDGETVGAHAMEDMGAPALWVEKMKSSFSKLRKSYCSPPTLDDKKILAVQKCDPTTNFEIAHKCHDDAFKGKTLNERRKFECQGGNARIELDHHIQDCIHKKVQETKSKTPQPIPMEEIRKMSHEQLVQRVQKMIDQIQSCLEKAVA